MNGKSMGSRWKSSPKNEPGKVALKGKNVYLIVFSIFNAFS